MTEPLLVPAYPEVLRAGLPALVLESYSDPARPQYERVLCLDAESVVSLDGRWARTGGAHVYQPKPERLRLDLRDPAVVDACVRGLWRRLRPEEPEPLTAPRWEYDFTVNVVRWALSWRDDPEHRTYARQVYAAPGTRNNDAIVVPALADVPLDSPQRDRLALAAVLRATFGGAT